ncbi:MAG: LLM class F420-dependent oxidoreductase [Brevefilum sp.]
MKYGVVFPQTEFPSDPEAIKDFTQAAEDLGYNHILTYDHVLGVNPDREGGWSGPYSYTDPFQEPLTLFSFMAGFTRKLEFITGIIILPQRQTALVAKQAATLDVLSGGRLRLGVALGWNEVEYKALNKDFRNRGDRFEEQIQVLKRLWTEELVTFDGQWHSIQDAGINPLPVQRPIPLWLGGHADPVLQRVAKMADGWLPNYRTPGDASEALEKLQTYLEEENRSMADIGMEPRLRYEKGNPEEWARLAEDWQHAGATHLTVITMGQGFKTAEEHIEAIEAYAKALVI